MLHCHLTPCRPLRHLKLSSRHLLLGLPKVFAGDQAAAAAAAVLGNSSAGGAGRRRARAACGSTRRNGMSAEELGSHMAAAEVRTITPHRTPKCLQRCASCAWVAGSTPGVAASSTSNTTHCSRTLLLPMCKQGSDQRLPAPVCWCFGCWLAHAGGVPRPCG